jgi:hypothetical protein
VPAVGKKADLQLAVDAAEATKATNDRQFEQMRDIAVNRFNLTPEQVDKFESSDSLFHALQLLPDPSKAEPTQQAQVDPQSNGDASPFKDIEFTNPEDWDEGARKVLEPLIANDKAMREKLSQMESRFAQEAERQAQAEYFQTIKRFDAAINDIKDPELLGKDGLDKNFHPVREKLFDMARRLNPESPNDGLEAAYNAMFSKKLLQRQKAEFIKDVNKTSGQRLGSGSTTNAGDTRVTPQAELQALWDSMTQEG